MVKRVIGAVRFTAAALAALIIAAITSPTAFSEEEGEQPQLSAYAYSLYCVNNGEFVAEQRGSERLPMASTTKIMTALLALEADEKAGGLSVTITPEMYAEGSSMYLAAGEKVKMKDLVGGMLMVSGNDAANAAALTIGGSREEFARLMIARAAELGLKDTHFVTPSGLDADGHFTTARDLARLMASCMENETFAGIESSSSVTVDFIEPEDKSQTYYNENRLLTKYEYCIGGKTGFTDKAGRTLVSCAEKDGVRLVAVTLNDGDDWNDHQALYDYGFDTLSMEKPEKSGEEFSVTVVGGSSGKAMLTAGEPPLVCRGVGESEITTRCELAPFVYAPVEKGQKLGELKYYTGGVYAGKADLTAAESVGADGAATTFTENIASFFRALFVRLKGR